MLSPNASLLLRLSSVSGIGPVRIQQLLTHYSYAQLHAATLTDWQNWGLSTKQCQELEQGNHSLECSLKWLEYSSHQLVSLADEMYPERLKMISSPPPVLFVVGDMALLNAPQVAIVGSRHAGFNAMEQVRRLASELAALRVVVTSGLALGIDSAAHQGALMQGKTIAVMGTGPDQVYPRRHRKLAETILEQGAIVTEFPPGTVPRAQNFPRRNRVISGLSLGVVVSEAARQSGSLITAKYALEQNRELFAIPGNIDNPLTQGPHQLIQHGAKLVTCCGDILDELWPLMPDILDKVALDTDNIDQQQLPSGGLLDNVGYETTTIDQVVERSLLPVDKVISALIELEMSGEIVAVSGGYVRLRRNP
ncbi:DNA-processing protein DprA [Celerinatantimonas sp. YJH-8]|uniref:DNA-processing protein DprA n=1 Tax=Celerinatantimonas sp. YJH-8 TaxID=3228714 RepID=UPI0038C246D0